MSNRWWPETAAYSEFLSPSLIVGGNGLSARTAELLGRQFGIAEGTVLVAVDDIVLSNGLADPVFTQNLDNAFRFIEGVDTGQVSVNQPTSGWDVHQPFGGFKDSGSAFKEQGLEALRFYSRVKTAAIRTH
ncbi:MAG: putative NAD+-dependent aldehyde dehydrogenase [Subtercola sp.]|nr:putative NAD+-dependent aldehyde dehydrogenase [Subtercola sp.]